MSEFSINAEVTNQLKQFQQKGDVDELIAYGKSQGHSEQGLRAVTVLLYEVFEALSLGMQPPYEELDREQLLEHKPEAELVARCMVQSSAADLKTAGFHVMGLLNLKSFIPDLQAALASKHGWERIEAAGALGRMTHREVRDILLASSKHTDRHTRDAASDALK